MYKFIGYLGHIKVESENTFDTPQEAIKNAHYWCQGITGVKAVKVG